MQVRLTQSLNLITEDLADETGTAVRDLFGEEREWSTQPLKAHATDLVARLSSRVFLGSRLCRNERWLQISKTYTIDVFTTAYLMRAAPAVLRPIVYWLLPQSKALRQAVRDARAIIEPELARRQAAVDAALAAGEKPPKTADTLGWMYEYSVAAAAKQRKDKPVRVDFAAAQISLSMAAIHTTTETLSQALLDICEYPAVADELRAEIVRVLGASGGWTKTALYQLRLMDSFLKEGQRFHPLFAGRASPPQSSLAYHTSAAR